MHHLVVLSRLTVSQRRTFDELGIRGGHTARVSSCEDAHSPAVVEAADRIRRAGLSIAPFAREIATRFNCHPSTAARWISRKLYGLRRGTSRRPPGLEPPQAGAA